MMPSVTIHRVSMVLLSARAVQGADVGNSGPCNDAVSAEDNPTPTFCQPSEESGHYDNRFYTMQATELCDYLESGSCFTLDDMICEGDPRRCLKWGKDAYFGRVILPDGVKLYGYGSWSCDGDPHSTTIGGRDEAVNLWDYNWREDAFKLELVVGYQCDSSANPPVQMDGAGQSGFSNVQGYWRSVITGDGTVSKTLSVGMSYTSSETVTNSDQESFGFSMTEDANFLIEDTKISVTGSYAHTWTDAVMSSSTTSSSMDTTITCSSSDLPDGAYGWNLMQWVLEGTAESGDVLSTMTTDNLCVPEPMEPRCPVNCCDDMYCQTCRTEMDDGTPCPEVAVAPAPAPAPAPVPAPAILI